MNAKTMCAGSQAEAGGVARRAMGLLAALVLMAPGAALAATMVTTDSTSGVAHVYDPAKDYSPGTAFGGYHPPTQLGGYDAVLTLAGFDQSLGTLTAVTITQSSMLSLSLYAIEIGGTDSTIYMSGEVSAQTPYGEAGDGYHAIWSQTEPPGSRFQTPVVTASHTSSYTNIFPDTFTPFYDPVIYIPILAVTNFDMGVNASYLLPSDADGPYWEQLTITYDYTPAAVGVPEPASWALMLLGFAGLGAVYRWRRGARPLPTETLVVPA